MGNSYIQEEDKNIIGRNYSSLTHVNCVEMKRNNSNK
jgi:hypothetical protein